MFHSNEVVNDISNPTKYVMAIFSFKVFINEDLYVYIYVLNDIEKVGCRQGLF